MPVQVTVPAPVMTRASSGQQPTSPQFTSVRPGMVGCKQRRFIIWHSVPAGLDDAESVTAWLAAALPETARLVREHLPRKSKAYPSEELADEVECLRDELLRLDESGLATRTRRHERASNRPLLITRSTASACPIG